MLDDELEFLISIRRKCKLPAMSTDKIASIHMFIKHETACPNHRAYIEGVIREFEASNYKVQKIRKYVESIIPDEAT